MKTKRIVISMFLALALSSTAFANETNPVENNETSRIEVKTKSKNSGVTIKYYGEKAGLFRPCKGTCILVCKEIIKNDRSGTAIVTDGEDTIVVDIEKINFEDGSINL